MTDLPTADGLNDDQSTDEDPEIGEVARLIDAAGDAKSTPSLDQAARRLDALAARDLPACDRARLHYYRSNLWAHRAHLAGEDVGWSWEKPAQEQQVLELRRAIRHAGFEALEPLVRAQALTNLANSLNGLGRFVEAVELWDRALLTTPRLAMARGNRGMGLSHYARALHDPRDAAIALTAAWDGLRSAAAPDAIVESPGLDPALSGFAALADQIERVVDVAAVSRAVDPYDLNLGRSKNERAYRTWCLAQRLFIDPLNDLGPWPIAARDVLSMPDMVTSTPETPVAIRFFNLMKQEYASARFSFYEGVRAQGVHFSDRGVRLFNTLDYPALSLGVERVKMAYRSAYALFDKTAFVLNAYFGLGHDARRVNFRNVWFDSHKAKTLHPRLDGLANWPLRGLYWLSKDIFEDQFRQVTEPDAQALYDLRNHLEHKFVAVHDSWLWPLSSPAPPTPGVYDLAFDELINRTLRLLKLGRACLIHLALAVHAEESRRAADAPENTLSVTMPLDAWDDRWKQPL